MLREKQLARNIEQTLQADLQAVKELQPPGFRLDAAVAKFTRKTRSDELVSAWAARVERQPASGVLANLIDRVGLRRLVAGTILLFAGVATAGTIGVLVTRPLAPTRTVDVASIGNAPPALSKISVTPFPLPPPSPEVSQPPAAAHRRHVSFAATGNGVEQEIEHMVMLRKLVERNPRKALAWAEQGHRQFVHGALYEEREALYVLAAIKVNGVNAATPRARAFLSRFPKGSFAARIHNAVER
jgi:hypothetical protein